MGVKGGKEMERGGNKIKSWDEGRGRTDGGGTDSQGGNVTSLPTPSLFLFSPTGRDEIRARYRVVWKRKIHNEQI